MTDEQKTEVIAGLQKFAQELSDALDPIAEEQREESRLAGIEACRRSQEKYKAKRSEGGRNG